MRRALRAAFVCLCVTSGCAEVEIPEPCTPGELPPIGQHQLVGADDATPDAVTADSATPDTVTPDAVTPDTATPDAATPDTATPDDAALSDASADTAPAPAAPADPFEAAREDVERSADWLLCVVPDQLPDDELDAWVQRRNMVMDWIENHPTLSYTFNASIMAPIHKDKRFNASMYMNLAYAIGKARYLLSADPPDPVEAEVAALDGVAQYYAAFKAIDPKLKARKLKRLMRKKRKGTLREWILKHMYKS